MTEGEIRQDERKKAAQELLKAYDTAGRAVKPGLRYAATLLDPIINGDEEE